MKREKKENLSISNEAHFAVGAKINCYTAFFSVRRGHRGYDGGQFRSPNVMMIKSRKKKVDPTSIWEIQESLLCLCEQRVQTK